MSLVFVGGPDAAEAAPVLVATGLTVKLLGSDGAQQLREADAGGIGYTLVHVGADDGEPEGTYARAHHRTSLDALPALAERLKPRARPLVTCLSFGFKNGLPEHATWLVDVRFLDNPYWVEALRPLTGVHPEVIRYVLEQPAAIELLDRLEAALRWAIPLYRGEPVVVAFGCTGGRHRSVVVAAELARRLQGVDGVDVRFESRDLKP